MMTYHWHNIQLKRNNLFTMNKLQLLFIFHISGDIYGYCEGGLQIIFKGCRVFQSRVLSI